MKIYYKSDGVFLKTKCPYGYKSDWGISMVNSIDCRRRCKFYRSTNHKEKYVVCMADCSSHLQEILNKIDVIIANDKFDDICFEDFLAEIREDIASVLDNSEKLNMEE